MNWEISTEEKFRLMIAKIPVFLRPLAQDRVAKKAQALAEGQNSPEVLEKHMVDAFFLETPFGFHGPMKTDMKDIGINYAQYGHAE